MSKHRRKLHKYISIETIEQLCEILTEYPGFDYIESQIPYLLRSVKDPAISSLASIVFIDTKNIEDSWCYNITIRHLSNRLIAIWSSHRVEEWNKYDAPVLNKFLSKYRWAGPWPEL